MGSLFMDLKTKKMTEQLKIEISKKFDKLDRDLEAEHPSYAHGYKSALFDAMEVINKLPIQIVSKRYYWLKADGTISNMWDEKTHKETINDDMMQIAEKKGWSLIQINVC